MLSIARERVMGDMTIWFCSGRLPNHAFENNKDTIDLDVTVNAYFTRGSRTWIWRWASDRDYREFFRTIRVLGRKLLLRQL
jgi:hypothetical protein